MQSQPLQVRLLGPIRPKLFGDLVVFDDPITLDNNLHSPPTGRAKGFYIYDKKDIFSAWVGFLFVFNPAQDEDML